MAFTLTCNIEIGAYRFRQVNEVKIESSWQQLADICTIKLAKLGDRLKEAINEGDPVKVILGYEGKYEGVEFEGFVRRKNPNIPYEIECEDSVYPLRFINLSNSWRSTTLEEVVNYIIDGTGIELIGELPEVKFAKFRLNQLNGAQALQKIADEYGLAVYFRGNKLFAGLAYTDDQGEVNYDFSRNTIDTDLQFRKAEDVKLKVNAVGILKNNTKIEVQTGDSEGDQRTLHFYGVTDKATLEKLAKEEIQKYKYNGYDGDFNTFLVPRCVHGMTANVLDPEFPERAGSYHVDKVVTTFGMNGARRNITLGPILSAT